MRSQTVPDETWGRRERTLGSSAEKFQSAVRKFIRSRVTQAGTAFCILHMTCSRLALVSLPLGIVISKYDI